MKPTYSNDRKAPRMRKGEFSKLVVTRELHKKFIKEFPEYKELEWQLFYKSWLEIATKVRYEAIYNPLGMKLGSYLGELKLQYLPHKFEAVDHAKSQELGMSVNYLNLEGKGKVPKIKWERREAVKRNKILQFYAFDETRELNKLAHTYLLNNASKLRVSRVTLGGVSVWRQKTKK